MSIHNLKRTLKWMCFGVVFMTVLTGGAIYAMAETVLKTITVSTSSPSFESGSVRIPEFRAPKGCDLDLEWISSSSSFGPGKNVTAQITLTTQDDYRFASNTKITVSGATVSSKTISDYEIVMRVKVGPLSYKLAEPEDIAWSSEKSSIVKWSSVKYATEYRVRVYQDDKVVKQETVKTRSYDAGKYFNGESEVRVSVTALGTGSSDSKYLKQSDEAFVDGSDVDWEDRETTYGVWEGKKYRLTEQGEDKEYAKGWTEIFGKWYFFNDNGTLQTGWIDEGGRRYYSDKDGIMQTGWVKTKENDAWYFFRSDGQMATGWLAASAPGSWFYLGTDGSMKTGWILDNQQWYFMGTDGVMQKGWQSINDGWYYFYEDGHMAVSETVDSYFVNGEGKWLP